MAKKDVPQTSSMTNQSRQGYGHAGPRWQRLQEGHVPAIKGHAPVMMQGRPAPPPPPPKTPGIENVGRAPKK